MRRFVLLTDKAGDPVVVAADTIVAAVWADRSGPDATTLWMGRAGCDLTRLAVRERPEAIFALLNDASADR